MKNKYGFKYVLVGAINYIPIAIPFSSLWDCEVYVDMLRQNVEKYGGMYNLTLWNDDSNVAESLFRLVNTRVKSPKSDDAETKRAA